MAGKECRYQEVMAQRKMDDAVDPEFGREIAEMFTCTSYPGFDGGKLEKK